MGHGSVTLDLEDRGVEGAVVIGFLKMRSHSLEHEVAGDDERAALVALGHEGEQDLGLVGVCCTYPSRRGS
jgi:hypothetical protein